jgi:hypothetical protein
LGSWSGLVLASFVWCSTATLHVCPSAEHYTRNRGLLLIAEHGRLVVRAWKSWLSRPDCPAVLVLRRGSYLGNDNEFLAERPSGGVSMSPPSSA